MCIFSQNLLHFCVHKSLNCIFKRKYPYEMPLKQKINLISF